MARFIICFELRQVERELRYPQLQFLVFYYVKTKVALMAFYSDMILALTLR